MTFADIPQGVSVFIDANPFVYHFGPHPIYAPSVHRFSGADQSPRGSRFYVCLCVE
jgi:hypothetical protein